MKTLTMAQYRILSGVMHLLLLNGYPPSVRDLAELEGGASTNAIHRHLVLLTHKGFITRKPGVARSIVLTSAGKTVLRKERQATIAR